MATNTIRLLITFFTIALISSAHSISLGQVDDFQDGSVQAWQGGTLISNEPDGGPSGAGDRFLRVESFGGSGPGSRLATYNTLQWSGDYLTAGVKAVEVHIKNFSNVEIHMRVVLFAMDGSRWTSAQATVIPANSGWVRVTFLITESALTRVWGFGDYNLLMGNVTQLMFRHDPTGSANGAPIVAVMGLDNITAVAGPTILPNSFTVLWGDYLNGNVQSLHFQDTDRLIVRARAPFTPTLPSVDVQVDGTSTLSTVSSMSLRVVTSTSAFPAGNVPQTIQMFNFGSNTYETVDSRFATAGDNVIVITPAGDPNRFIQGGTRLVRMRVRWFDPFTLAAPGWAGRINQVNWLTGI